MTDDMTTHSLFDALLPLSKRLRTERTLSPGKIGVLRHLAEQGRATTSALADVVQVSPQAISLAVQELERLGYVLRTQDAEDRRRTWIEITEAGQQKLEEDLSARRAWLDQAIATKLSAAERKDLAAAVPLLRKLTAETSDE